MGVEDGIVVSNEDDELIAIFLLQLAAPALWTLTVEQVVRKERVGVVCPWCRWLVAASEHGWCGEMASLTHQGTGVGQDFTAD